MLTFAGSIRRKVSCLNSARKRYAEEIGAGCARYGSET
jgi:hypothetical protein